MIRKFSTSPLVPVLMISFMSVFCAAQPQTLLTRHVRDVVANGVAPAVGRLPQTQIMRFDIVLALRHAPELENFLKDIYDPTSPNYRHFIAPQEFTARFGPSQEDYDAVVQFAKANGFKVAGGTRDGRVVQLKGAVADIEKAFHVTMGLYHDPEENRTFYAPDREPTVDLPFQLWAISGLDNYSIPHTNAKRSNGVKPNIAGSCPSNTYCGSDMRAAYYGTGSLTGTGQTLGLLELAGTNLSDLSLYYTNVHQTQPFVPTLVSTGGFSTSCTGGCDDAEQTLDMTQPMGVAPGMTMLYMYVCGDAFGTGTFNEVDCLSAMVTASPLNLQLSSSWSWRPADPSTDDPYFQQMAAQGQSLFDAAGDSGAWVSGGFAFPGEDTNVICVGGTDLLTKGAGGSWQSETGWPDSGGGISPDGFAIPSWQQLPGVINSQNQGSTTLRNGPDVAAEANFDFYVCHLGGCQGGWGGTSFAAPMWAGYMALANQQAVANGVPAPGFINPAIYPLGLSSGYAAAFHDITSGNNGFPAVAGYDLVTGWGSPNGPGLINALTGPQGPSFSLTANPNTLTLTQGHQGTSTVTAAPLNGFSGTVGLSVSGCPANTTCTLNPTSVTLPPSQTSTLTVQTTSTTPGGTFTLTITGTSGSLTQTTTVTLIIPDFSITATPPSQQIVSGGNAAYKATLAAVNGFSGTVGVTVSGCPANSTCTLNPTSVTLPPSRTSTLTVQTTKTTPGGTYILTITGTSGSTVHSTSVTLVVKAPDFSLYSGTSVVRVKAGGNAGYGLTLTPLLGFKGSVKLSVTGLPSKSSDKFAPNPVSVTAPKTSKSVLTVSTTTTTPVGTYTLTIMGTSGSLQHSVNVNLIVAAP